MTLEQGAELLAQITFISNMVAMVIILIGIGISVLITRFLWKIIFKPIIRDHLQLNI